VFWRVVDRAARAALLSLGAMTVPKRPRLNLPPADERRFATWRDTRCSESGVESVCGQRSKPRHRDGCHLRSSASSLEAAGTALVILAPIGLAEHTAACSAHAPDSAIRDYSGSAPFRAHISAINCQPEERPAIHDRRSAYRSVRSDESTDV
jgi:hypothetical protein